jgi:hypothetical protein
LACAELPSTAASAVNSVLVRAVFFAIRERSLAQSKMSVLNWAYRDIERRSLPVLGSKRAFPFATATTSHAILSTSLAGPLTGLSNVVAYVCRLSRERFGVHVQSSHQESARQAAVSTRRRPPSACATNADGQLRLPLCAVSPISGAPIRYERIPGRPRALRRNIVSRPGFSSPLYGCGVDTSCDAPAFAIGRYFGV